MKSKILNLFAFLALLLAGNAQAAQSVTYYHLDALGSVIAKSDAEGYLYLNEEYQPLGETIYGTEDFFGGSDDWYAGKNYSEELDLSYFGVRWYDAKQGRFLSIDPVGVKLEKIHSFNRYLYANNNPYKYIDPNGEEGQWADGNYWDFEAESLGMDARVGRAYQKLGKNIAENWETSPALIVGTGTVGITAAFTRVSLKKGTTVLGENMLQRVIPYAEKTGARTLPFGTTAKEWAKMSAKERWKLNDGALRRRIKEGDSFEYLGRDPGRSPATRKRFDLTGSELLRLEERGIPYETVSP